MSRLSQRRTLDTFVTQSWGIDLGGYYNPKFRGTVVLPSNRPTPGWSVPRSQTHTTRHLVHTELSGGWEYGDVCLGGPSITTGCNIFRMYSNMFHAFSNGSLRAAQGNYMALADNVWTHKADTLISVEQVRFAKESIDKAVIAARGVEKAHGCRFFYNRTALVWMNENDVSGDYGEYSDLDFSTITQSNWQWRLSCVLG